MKKFKIGKSTAYGKIDKLIDDNIIIKECDQLFVK